MKIKKFNNLWTMGLIICGVLLVAIYLLKIIVPNFVVGVAEVDVIVRFGEYVDTHWWAYYIFTFVTSFATFYVYSCASCRVKYLNWKGCLVITVAIIALLLIEKFAIDWYLVTNIVLLIVCPAVICYLNKVTETKYIYSIVVCFAFENLAEVLSLQIRDISTAISYPNSATYFILLIDVFIWQILLYNYYNYKEIRE